MGSPRTRVSDGITLGPDSMLDKIGPKDLTELDEFNRTYWV
jgi:hypothetical protein